MKELTDKEFSTIVFALEEYEEICDECGEVHDNDFKGERV